MFKFICLFFLSFGVIDSVEINFDFEKESNKIVSIFLKEIKKKYQLSCCGLGGGSRGEINTISIHLDSNNVLNINDTRKLIVAISDLLCQKFNENTAIRPYLHNYPFCSDNLDINISFTKKSQNLTQVSLVVLDENKIRYFSFDQYTQIQHVVHKESYQEALNIYRTQFICQESK